MNSHQTRDASSYAKTSFWLEDCGDDLTPRQALSSDLTCDVAILGGGFSGLWTAYYLSQENPGLDIVVVERDICGYGASGRNGAWVSPRFPLDASVLIRRFGLDIARQTIQALEATVAEVGSICSREGIDAQYRVTGLLSLARGPSEMDVLNSTYRTYERLGLAEGQELMSAEAAFASVHATNIHGGLRSTAGAVIHPARLARGLARTLEKRGVRIFEQTAALRVRSGATPAIETAGGLVTAKQAAVIAAEAYLADIPDFHRTVLPMSSMIVLTEPLSADKWRQIGWDGGECLSSQIHTKNYLTKTADGRILYGSRGARYQFASKLPDDVIADEAVFTWMRDCVREWWPDALKDVKFTHGWGGYLGVPRDWLPSVSFDRGGKIGHLYGYTGRGVATSALSAKLLANQILGKESALSALPLHRASAPRWEVEPFRWAAVRYLQNAYSRIDAADQANRARPLDARFAEWLGGQ